MWMSSLGSVGEVHFVHRTSARRLNRKPLLQKRVPLPFGVAPGRKANIAWESRPHPTCTAAVDQKEPGPKPKKKAKVNPHIKQVLDVIAPGEKIVVAQTAPAVRVSLGEAVGLPPGTNWQGKMVSALRQLGFDYVFDTLFAADLTIMEEGYELLDRLYHMLKGDEHSKKEPMPMFTSCCPGWIQMAEKSYPELLPHISSCKSPHMMMGAVLKTHFAEKVAREPKDIVVVSIMPCVRKQGEADRDLPSFCMDGDVRFVDHVWTTVELGAVLLDKGIDLESLPDGDFDDPLGASTGAANLFGTTGGVMEAALRTFYEVATGTPLPELNLMDVRGLDGVKEGVIHVEPSIDGPLGDFVKEGSVESLDVRIAVANGLGNAKKIIQAIKSGEKEYDFVEVMACPGGCIGGGGQPRSKDKEILKKRQQAIYSLDERRVFRRSHENPFIQTLYEQFLGVPLSEQAHELLHTTYVAGGPGIFTDREKDNVDN